MKDLRVLCLVTVVTAFVLGCASQLHADTINIYIGGGTATFTNTGSGQQIVFVGNDLNTPRGDSSRSTPLEISAGSGSFLFTSVSGGHGYFSGLNGAFFTMGDETSGIARGSITSIEIIGTTVGTSQTSFTVQLGFNNLSFQGCTVGGCTNSAVLQRLGTAAYGNALLSVYFSNDVATNVNQLLALAGSNESTMSGEFDATVTPEPASLALFGTGLLVVGIKVRRWRNPKN